MTIDEAIKILEWEAHLCERQPETGVSDALRLGIEALKYLQAHSPYPHAYQRKLLPGETTE